VPTAAARIRRAVSATPPAIRVLVIDDSVVARAALSRIISDSDEFELVAALDGAQRAIDWLRESQVDIILLDIQMPGLDGLEALPRLIEVSNRARILMVSTLAAEGAKATVRALSLGAADTLAKPQIGGLGQTFAGHLIDKMRRLGRANRNLRESVESQDFVLRPARRGPIACLAIGASTGGLHALASFFGALPETFRAPILVTQHLPPAFMEFFAEQLAVLSGRPTVVAGSGTRIEEGHIYVAPGHAHLGCSRSDGTVRAILLDHDVESRCCPSVDPMFASVADVFGSAALGVVLTGMGRDGAIGAEIICKAGGSIIAQDAASSTVWGMPGTVARAGLSSLVAPPAQLAAYVRRCGSDQ
jgi:two-component system, chemotaxis family, protein-glutamate methylesterase/glutaminase